MRKKVQQIKTVLIELMKTPIIKGTISTIMTRTYVPLIRALVLLTRNFYWIRLEVVDYARGGHTAIQEYS